jgi:antitoxin PrlF
MANTLERVSTITGKGQTTVPKPIRDALGVGAGDRIVFRVDGDRVSVRRVDESGDDPAIDAFLAFVAADMQRRPEALSALSPTLAKRVAELIEAVEIDSNETIDGPVAL